MTVTPENVSLMEFLNHIAKSPAQPKEKFLKLSPSDAAAAEAKEQVYEIYKKKLPHFDSASGELAPIFGLGSDLIAKQRAQGLFKHPAFVDAYVEFAETYLAGRWDLPVAEWSAVHKLLHRHTRDADWSKSDVCPSREGWDVNHFYTRFVMRTMAGIKTPSHSANHMVWWLQGAESCEVCFVLLHALMYLQLETMRDYRKHAPAKDRIGHLVASWKTKLSS